jgi:3-deoxy-D-manno-octulosonate 8-phosphate phosphatase (KDO 8-P phosphatase)
MKNIIEKAKKIRLLIFDVDGVLTDGILYIADDGQEQRAFNARDGLGMRLLRASGVEIAIISGKTSLAVTHRMRTLGIQHVYQGQLNKVEALNNLCQQLQLPLEEIAYVGDDVNDLPVMTKVGLAIAVADAHPTTVNCAHWQTQAKGGHGAAREVCDFIMQAQGTLNDEVKRQFSHQSSNL